jgi:tRNA1(Val) A37 N6-methylase TrmN6
MKKLNDLFDYEYSIYQNIDFFKFSLDSILLAEFINIKKDKYKVLDLCTGNAPIPMILTSKYGKHLDITCIELQQEIFELGKESIEYNKLDNIHIINDDINNAPNLFKEKFDVISCNPPYFETLSNNFNDNEIKAIARHELKMTLEDCIRVASKLIEFNGSFYIVHKPERLVDIINYLKQYGFGVKRIANIYTNHEGPAETILVEATFRGKDYVKILNPIFINDYKSYKGIFEGK